MQQNYDMSYVDSGDEMERRLDDAVASTSYAKTSEEDHKPVNKKKLYEIYNSEKIDTRVRYCEESNIIYASLITKWRSWRDEFLK